MAIRFREKFLVVCSLCALLTVVFAAAAWSGPLRLIMKDGTSIEVSYYWLAGGEYKFDIPGGIAGVPASQVTSVQELVESKEFDPDALMQGAAETTSAEDRKLIQDLISSNSPGAMRETETPEHGLERLKKASSKENSADKPKINAKNYTIVKSIPFISDEPGGPVLVIQELLSSNVDLKGNEFTIVLYDSDGNVLSRKPCEVYPLTLGQKEQKKLRVKSRVYLVRASITPDPKIKRFEIASTQR